MLNQSVELFYLLIKKQSAISKHMKNSLTCVNNGVILFSKLLCYFKLCAHSIPEMADLGYIVSMLCFQLERNMQNTGVLDNIHTWGGARDLCSFIVL